MYDDRYASRCAVGLGFLLIVIPTTWAVDQTVILKLGAESELGLERPFKTALMGNPTIIDVHTQSGPLRNCNPGTRIALI